MREDELPIETPCGADWTTMTPTQARARLCGTCSTIVHDVAAMDPESVRRLLETGPACIRYVHDAHGNVIFGPVPEGVRIVPAAALLSRVARNRWLASAAVVGATLLFEACGPAPRRHRPVEERPSALSPGMHARLSVATDAAITACRTEQVKAICEGMPVGEYTFVRATRRASSPDEYVVDVTTAEANLRLTFVEVDGELRLVAHNVLDERR